MTATHGLAGSIRSAEEHETFDLGGMTVDSIVTTLEAAFQEPFTVDADMSMIRLTFVIGAGKQNRQKYDAGATKATVTALMNCGYQEDKGASCVLECAGFYKQQHDTGKNLKTVVVFPKFKTLQEENENAATKTPAFMDTDSIPYKVAVGSTAMLENMVIHKCPTWSQKKTLVGILEDLSKTIATLDDKLIHGTLLNDSEQVFYDEVIQLSQKQDHVKEKLQVQVEQGKLTAFELKQLKDHNAERLEELQQQGKSTAKVLQRKELLDGITTTMPPLKLKHHAELGKLWKQVGPLLQLEQQWKGQGDRLLTVKETLTMGKKDELLQDIDEYEQASRGWLEDDDMFQSRLQACRQEFGRFLAKNNQPSNKSKAKKSGGGGGTTISSSTRTRVPAAITKWSVPNVGGNGGYKSTAMGGAKKKSKLQKADLFGAMMVDSDSEEEDDDDDEDDEDAEETQAATKSTSTSNETKPSATKEAAPKSTSKKSKKKKKGKSNTGNNNNNTPDDQMATSSTSKDKSSEDDEAGGSHIVVQILSILFSILWAILTWIISLFFGKSKTTNSKKKN